MGLRLECNIGGNLVIRLKSTKRDFYLVFLGFLSFPYFFFFFLSFIEVDFQCCDNFCYTESDSVICIHPFIVFQILFLCRLSQDIGQSSLCYAAGPRCPVIPFTTVCRCQSQIPSPSLPPIVPFGNNKFVSKIHESVSVLKINSFVS